MLRHVSKALSRLAQIIASAYLWFLTCFLGGGAMIVAGVRILAGIGYAFIVAGCLAMVIAILIRKGMSDG
jgi:hypothetical protein